VPECASGHSIRVLHCFALAILLPYTPSMMSAIKAAERIYSLVRIVSLDVAAAALGGGILAMRVIGSTPRPSFYWLLPAGVWVAYTLDHLLDAHRIGPDASTPRHRFHYEHATILWIVAAIISGICAIGGWIGLSWFGLTYAAVMCALVIVHETIIKLAGNRASPLLIKELGVAIVFTAGVWGMPWLRYRLDTGQWLGWPVLLMVQYFLLAVVNLIEFSIYESKSDFADGHTSFVLAIGRRRSRKVVTALLVLLIAIGPLAILFRPTHIVIACETIYLAMSIGLWIVLANPLFAARAERYRTIGDGVFLLPLVLAIHFIK
jgi:hypothetical protein